MASNKFKDYSFECVFCDPNMEMHFTTTQEAMLKHCRIAHNVDESRATIKYNLGLMECFKVMTGLEYLHLYDTGPLFDQYSFVQFPSNLKYLAMYYVSNAAQILTWVVKGCKNLKGLLLGTHCSTDENVFHAISQNKGLTYLSMPFETYPYEIGYVFKELIELRALEIYNSNEMAISAIAQHCKKLVHLYIYDSRLEISAEMHANILRLASLPHLCSLVIAASNYSKEQITEFVNRLIAKGNLQYLKIFARGPLEPEVLLEILRHCKSIRSVYLNFGSITSDFYSKICQVVDEIDVSDRQLHELTGEEHPIVEVQYRNKRHVNITTPYKWIRFKDELKDVSPSVVCEKWQFGWLSAGKPEWER